MQFAVLRGLRVVFLEDATFHEIVHGRLCDIVETSRGLDVWRGQRAGGNSRSAIRPVLEGRYVHDYVGSLDGNVEPVETPRRRTSEVSAQVIVLLAVARVEEHDLCR